MKEWLGSASRPCGGRGTSLGRERAAGPTVAVFFWALSLSLAATAAAQPNFVVEVTIAPSEAVAGVEFEVSWTVQNVGDAPAESTSFARLFLSEDATAGGFEDLDDIGVAEVEIPALAAGDAQAWSASVSAESVHHFLIVWADTTDVVSEGEEDDNFYVHPIEVRNPILSVGKQGKGFGVVTSSPPGIDCGVTCQAGFAPDTPVTLEVLPATGSTVLGWNGCTASGNTCDLTVENDVTVTVTFSQQDGLDAEFELSPASPLAGEVIQFTDLSTGEPVAWSWDFGDGSTSTGQHPLHSYSAAGVYSVTLQVADAGEVTSSETHTVTVTETPVPLQAEFAFVPAVPAFGEIVQFIDQSTGNPASWVWDFGDGGNSNAASPAHTFAEAGFFEVELTVSHGEGSDSIAHTVQVVDATLRPDFEFTPEAPVAGQTVRFLDRSTGSVTSRSWDFGDGGAATLPEPLHVYQQSGAYTVRLDVSSGAAGGASTVAASISKRIVIGEATFGVSLVSAVFSAREGRDDVLIRVRRGGDPAASASVRLEVRDGTAVRGTDYAAPPSVLLQWSAGDTSTKEVVIDVIDDAEVEGTEVLAVELTQPDGVTLGALVAASLVVLDDDFAAEPAENRLTEEGGDEPRVVSDANGHTAVVWREAEGGGFVVLGQIFAATGEPLGPPFPISARDGAGRSSPAAAWDAGGNLVVTWVEGGAQFVRADGRATAAEPAAASVLGRYFAPGGQPHGAPLLLSSADAADASDPNVAADASGEVIVTWDEPRGPRARVVNRNRQPAQNVAIDSESIDNAAKPEVAKLSTGDFVAVWKSDFGGGGIRARRFAETGTPRGAPFLVVPSAGADNPAVAVTAAGGFVVVWDAPTAGRGVDVFGQLFGSDGSPASAPFVVNDATAGDQRRARVDANSAGDFAVVFESSETPGGMHGTPRALTAQGQSILGRFFDPAAAPLGGDVPVAAPQAGLEPARPDVSIDDSDETTVVYEKRGPGDSAEGVATRKIKPRVAAAACDESNAAALCLQAARFQATVLWQDQAGNQGSAQAIPLTTDTGYFWFFDQDNVELVIKVLDGCALNGRYWVFATGLTDIEVELVVDDVLSGESKAWFSPLGQGFAPVLDTDAFATCGAAPAAVLGLTATETGSTAVAVRAAAELAALARDLTPAATAAPTGACTSDERTLCLAGGRFEVHASWRDASGNGGEATAVPLTADTGTFWFFDAANVELVVKVLAACVLNDAYWVFSGGLTDVEVTLSVADTATGALREYHNPLGSSYETVRDTSAFACP